MSKNVVVVGAQWGDEGKGKIVDWLTESVQGVVRFNGGHNAGHTLVINGQKTVLRLIPSGVMHPHVKCYIGNGAVVSPEAMLKEIDDLKAHGMDAEDRIFVSGQCPLVLPYHIALDHARENALGDKKIASGRPTKTRSLAALSMSETWQNRKSLQKKFVKTASSSTSCWRTITTANLSTSKR